MGAKNSKEKIMNSIHLDYGDYSPGTKTNRPS